MGAYKVNSVSHPFEFDKRLKWVPRISGDLVVKSKLPPGKWLCSVKAVETHPLEQAIKLFFKKENVRALPQGYTKTGKYFMDQIQKRCHFLFWKSFL